MDLVSLIVVIVVAWLVIGFSISLLPVSMQSDSALERLRSLHLKNKNHEKYQEYVDEINRRRQVKNQNKVVDDVVTPEFLALANETGQRIQALLEETMKAHGVSMEQAHDIEGVLDFV